MTDLLQTDRDIADYSLGIKAIREQKKSSVILDTER